MRRSVPRRNAATKMRHRVGGIACRSVRRAFARLARPIVGRPPRDERNIVARLARQRAAARKPRLDPRRAAIIGRGRKPKIAEALTQVRQQFRRFRDRLLGIERIGKPALGGRSRHELRNALRARVAGDAGPEAALLPDQPGEEIDRQMVRCRGALDHAAQAPDRWFRPLARPPPQPVTPSATRSARVRARLEVRLVEPMARRVPKGRCHCTAQCRSIGAELRAPMAVATRSSGGQS